MSILKVNARLARLKDQLRNNYWLLPSVMLVISFALGLVSLAVDRQLDQIPWKTGWIYMGGADGARALLSTLAGATLTLAGVVFSMNLVALTMASAQFGPRLLYNFVRDFGSQLTLGTFTAIFTFCMVVLREVQGEDGSTQQFIPHISVSIAGVMALCGLGVLIYFVHHVAVQIQAPIVIANVGLELEKSIKREFRNKLEPGQGRTDYNGQLDERGQPEFARDAYPVDARESGYVQTVDFSRLLVLATRFDLTLKLLLRPGDFAIEGTGMLLASPTDRVTDKMADELQKCIDLGRRRSAAQDIEFIVNELCEVGVRAMSPAINDPFTCIGCVDWLAAALEELFQRDCPASFICDDEDELRIVWDPFTHEGIMDSAFNQIRQFAHASPAVMLRLLEAYARLAGHARSEAERTSVRKHADMAIRTSRDSFREVNDVADAEERYKKVLANLAAGSEI